MTSVIFWITIYWAFASLVCFVFALLLVFYFMTIFRDRQTERVKIQFAFVWFDMWMGAFYDEQKRILYFCPAPMICFIFRLVPKELRAFVDESEHIGI